MYTSDELKEQKALEAFGSLKNERAPLADQLQRLYEAKIFRLMEDPEPGDWLSTQKESGQSYSQHVSHANPFLSSRNTISIQPLEASLNKNFLQMLKEYCQVFYFGAKIRIEPLIDSSKFSHREVNSRINPGTGKKQYNAIQMIKRLVPKVKSDAHCMMGVLTTDLYPFDTWNFVFGYALFKLRTGVFSFCRYDEGFFEKGKKTDQDLIDYRSCRVMAHEIGHMFGMHHCIFYNCRMNGMMTMEEGDKRPSDMCPVCIRKLQTNMKFDLRKRYQGLLDFCSKSKNPYFQKDAEFFRTLINTVDPPAPSKKL